MSLEKFQPKTIDLKALAAYDSLARARAILDVEDSLKQTGFLLMTGIYGNSQSQISSKELEALKTLSEKFFSLEERIKEKYVHIGSGGEDGYTAFATEAGVDPVTGEKGIPEPKEFYQLRLAPAKINGVRKIEEVPQLTYLMFQIQNALQINSRLLIEAVAEILDKPKDYFQRLDRLEEGNFENSVLRNIHYPAETLPKVQNVYQNFLDAGKVAYRAAPHKDINRITTLLLAQSSRGLQIKPQKSPEFIDVELNGADAVGNTGELLEIMSGGLFQATLHQVVAYGNSPSSRYSFPFFDHPVNLEDQGLPLLVSGQKHREFYKNSFVEIYGQETFNQLNESEMEEIGNGPTQILYKDALLNRLVDIGNFPASDPIAQKPWRDQKPRKAFVLER